MSRGWDRGGSLFNDSSSNRLICASPPGVGGPGPAGICSTPGVAPQALVCNVCTGLWPCDESPPNIIIGAADFSFEFWLCNRGPSNTHAISCNTGFGFPNPVSTTLEIGATVDWRSIAGAPQIRIRYNPTPGAGAFTSSAWIVAPSGWNHITVNWERAINATLYVNGIAAVAVGINAIALPSLGFFAQTDLRLGPQGYSSCDDPAEALRVIPRAVIGPMAAHLSLLSQAQMQSSFRGRRVQNIATTFINWDWRRLEGHTAWETDPNRIMWKAWETLENVGVASPRGPVGTVRVPDLSGNGNDWILTTVPCYGTVTEDKGPVGFMVDSFFTS